MDRAWAAAEARSAVTNMPFGVEPADADPPQTRHQPRRAGIKPTPLPCGNCGGHHPHRAPWDNPTCP